MPGTEDRIVTAPDGVRLAVREYGGQGRPTVLLLHGYPDDQTVWEPVVPLLTDRFQVITYDARGAGRSDAPRGRRRYALPFLAADLVAVLDAVSPGRPVHLVGHDWGAIQLWEPVTNPDLAPRIASFTAISGPCLDHARAWMRHHLRDWHGWPVALRQLARSWYTLFFQLPLLPELAWRSGLVGWALQRSERLPRRPPAANGVPGLALYRANMFRGAGHRERRTPIPVQLVVLTRDRFLDPRLVADAERWVQHSRQHTLPTGHWLQYSHPERLASWVTRFVTDVERDRAETQWAEAHRGEPELPHPRRRPPFGSPLRPPSGPPLSGAGG
jgi:pimeloyl-ACP methyl ester carboxylesterase